MQNFCEQVKCSLLNSQKWSQVYELSMMSPACKHGTTTARVQLLIKTLQTENGWMFDSIIVEMFGHSLKSGISS